MDWTNILGAAPSKITQKSLLNPQQEQYQNWALGASRQGLGQAFDFNPIATAAQNRFQQQTLPTIGERFAGMDAQRGSGYNQAVANAQRDLQLDLAGQQSQFQQQSQKTWADILSQAMRPSQENIVEQGQPNSFMDLLKVVGPLALRAYLAAQSGGGTEVAQVVGSGAKTAAQGGGWMDWFKNFLGGAGKAATQAPLLTERGSDLNKAWSVADFNKEFSGW